METLAFLESAVAYEDPGPQPEIRSLQELVPHTAQIGLAAGAVAVSLMTLSPQAEAAVRFNDVCPAVRDVQAALQREGFNPGSVDGVFGSRTLAAVKAFQRSEGIAADGVVGLSTASKLGLASAGDTNSVYAPGKRCTSSGGNNGGGGGGSVATVTARSGVNVRAGAGTNFAIIDTLPFGASVRVVETTQGWSRLANGGYVSSQFLSSGGNSGGGGGSSARVTAGIGANVRSGPSLSSAIIGGKGFGERVSLTSDRVNADGYTWAKLAGQPGWIATSALSIGSGSGSGSGGSGGGTSGNVVVSTNGNGLNARFGPGLQYGIGDSYLNGTSLRTTGRVVNGWVQLSNGLWVDGTWVS